MKTIGERLEYVRRQRRKSYRELAYLIGDITTDAIRKAIRENRIKSYYAEILSEKLKINRHWIFTGKGDPFDWSATAHITTPENYNLVDPNIWLKRLVISGRFSYKELGSIIGYSEAAFRRALKRRGLSFDQIEIIARHSGMADIFNKIFAMPDTEGLEPSSSIEKLVAKAAAGKVRRSLGAVLSCMEEQNVALTSLVEEIAQIRTSPGATPNAIMQRDLEERIREIKTSREEHASRLLDDIFI